MTTSIVCEDLDKSNLGWVNKYLERLEELLNQEKSLPTPNQNYCEYLLNEAENYRTLVNQYSSN